MTQLCIEEALMLRLRTSERQAEDAAHEESERDARLLEIAARQVGR